MTLEILEQKVKKLESDLEIAKEKLYKATPQKPLIHDELLYDNKKKELVHEYLYFCSYCGDQIRLNSKKHKCGQHHNWKCITR